jgi:hypothetical protein
MLFKWDRAQCFLDHLPPIGGVTYAYSYFAAESSPFGWHIEMVGGCPGYRADPTQGNFASIHILLWGHCKIWWTIPLEQSAQFVQVMKGGSRDAMATTDPPLSDLTGAHCDAFWSHREYMVDPRLLRLRGIKVETIVQKPGDIVMIHPMAFHSGFSTGFNISESKSVAFGDWELFARQTATCGCDPDTCVPPPPPSLLPSQSDQKKGPA